MEVEGVIDQVEGGRRKGVPHWMKDSTRRLSSTPDSRKPVCGVYMFESKPADRRGFGVYSLLQGSWKVFFSGSKREVDGVLAAAIHFAGG